LQPSTPPNLFAGQMLCWWNSLFARFGKCCTKGGLNADPEAPTHKHWTSNEWAPLPCGRNWSQLVEMSVPNCCGW
jgi:hypothetical protein